MRGPVSLRDSIHHHLTASTRGVPAYPGADDPSRSGREVTVMMLQNYTYVDPMMDPLVLLALMLGVVLVVAGGLALVLGRTSGSSASPTSEPATDQTPFVAPETYQPGGVPDGPRSDHGDWDDSVVHQTMRSAQDRSGKAPARSSIPPERQTA